MDINVALFADDPLANQIASLSRRLSSLGNPLQLDPLRGPFPHLTLYLTGFEEDSVEVIPVLLQGNLRGFAAPGLSIDGVLVSPRGTVMLSVKKTAELDTLHRWMLHKLNPFRMRARPQIWEERRHRLSPEEQARVDQLGFPQPLEAWAPHFTIGKIEPEGARDAHRLLGEVALRGYAPAIAIGTVGAHGSMPAVIGKAQF